MLGVIILGFVVNGGFVGFFGSSVNNLMVFFFLVLG